MGGHCISVDPWFLVESAPDISRLIYSARQVNDSQPHFVLGLISNSMGGINGKKITALGLAYKPDVDDLRESPAIEVVHLLKEAGAEVVAYEPYKPKADLPGISIEKDLEVALAGADAVILLVSHKELCDLSPSKMSKITPARILIDTVNGWDRKEWEAAGFTIFKLGANR